MKKINVLKNNRDFGRIISNYYPKKYKNFTIYIEKEKNIENYHFGISASKKLGNAVCRNKYKRIIRNIISKKNYQNGFNCIIILKKSIIEIEYSQIEIELIDALKNNNLIKE